MTDAGVVVLKVASQRPVVGFDRTVAEHEDGVTIGHAFADPMPPQHLFARPRWILLGSGSPRRDSYWR